MQAINSLLEQAAGLILKAGSLLITAGAGMGVDSGMPDFRGREGFWKTYPALGRAGMDFQSIASPDNFHDYPARAWGFYGHRLALYRQLPPHAGFKWLRQWGENKPDGCHVFTSNVDGHFQKAGFAEKQIYECHGSIHHLQCVTPCCADIWPASNFVPEVDNDNCLLLNTPPTCPHCHGLARPNILMFGDWGWIAARAEQQAQRMQQWLATIHNPVVIEIGAGTTIPSVRHFSERIAKQCDGKVIRINLREAAIDNSYGIGLPMGALEALGAINKAIEENR